MSNKGLLLAFGLMSLMSSCGNGSANVPDDLSGFVTDSITGGEVVVSGLSCADYICVADSLIWLVSNESPDENISVFKFDGNLIAKGIGLGQGRDEVLEISSLHVDDNDKVNLYDSRGGKLYGIVRADSSLRLTPLADELRLLDDAVVLADELLLKVPVDSPISYVLEKAGLSVDSLSYFPPRPGGVSENTHILACTGRVAVSLGDLSFVRCLAYDGGLDFFKIRNDKMTHTNRFSLFDMDYDERDASVSLPAPNESTRTGYSHVWATPGYFYASFSGRKALEDATGHTNEIHVFDHSGQPVRRYILSEDVGAFCVTEDDSRLFAEASNSDYTDVVAYQLKVEK